MASTGFLTEGGGLLKILYLGIRNSLEGLEDAAFSQRSGLFALALRASRLAASSTDARR